LRRNAEDPEPTAMHALVLSIASIALLASPAPAPQAGGKAPELAPSLSKEQLEARSLAARAVKAFQKGEYAKAAELAETARPLDPAYPLALKILGWVAVATGDDKRATGILTEALNADPGDCELQFLLARSHLRLHEWGAAKDLLVDLLKKRGSTAPLLLEVANACVGEEDWVGAEAALLEARRLAPKLREIADALVEVYERSEQPEKAILELAALARSFPKDGGLRYRQAHLLTSVQKFEQAASVLEEAGRLLPDDPMAHEMLERLFSGPLPDPVRLEFHQNWLKEHDPRRR
jgi:tetratricopeptide (TPR) repeat protein